MKSLFKYDVLINEVFYKCWHILEYIEKHPDMSNLDKEAIKNTIMEALVTRSQIDPNKQSLDLDNLCIVDDLDHHRYEEHPNISGIPLWMKDELRKKSLAITGGVPASLFLAKPPDKIVRYCVYDPNTAVSSIFEDATFYNTLYTSPTRGTKIESPRPFVEVTINNEKYLVDTLTKRILKTSWFKENYDLEILDQQTISGMSKKRLGYYKESVSECHNLAELIPTLLWLTKFDSPSLAEKKYEFERTKKDLPQEWERYEIFRQEMENFKLDGFVYKKDKP